MFRQTGRRSFRGWMLSCVSNPFIEDRVPTSDMYREIVRQLRQCANAARKALSSKAFNIGALFRICANVGASARTSLRFFFHIAKAPTMRQQCANAESPIQQGIHGSLAQLAQLAQLAHGFLYTCARRRQKLPRRWPLLRERGIIRHRHQAEPHLRATAFDIRRRD
ncbi:hypothetical protein FHW21_000254 [Paraburkholderia sp. WP4_3_2]|nr:hypothetical protein [Paraburkholderia sp. WP4_3_2]